MLPKFDEYYKSVTEAEGEEKEGMSTAKKAALGVGAAAALGGLGYLAGKKLGGSVGGTIGKLKGQAAGAVKDAAALPGKTSQYAKDVALASPTGRAAAATKDFWTRAAGIGRAALGMKDKGYSTKAIPDAVKPDYTEFAKKLGAAGLESGTKTGAGLGAVAGGTAGATAGAVGAHLATKDKKEKPA